MKNERQEKILAIIAASAIETQEQLIDSLRKEGISCTQATISRDIKQLHLIKEPTGNGSYRSSKLLLHEAGVRPGRILSYSNMSTARQLCALGLGALFVTGALFERTLPGGQERIAFCTLQQPVYTRTSVAAYRPENPRAALCREAIALTRELVLPQLELPV